MSERQEAGIPPSSERGPSGPARSAESGRYAVHEVRWPAERGPLEDLRARGIPRLVVVEAGEPPLPRDSYEDFILPSASDQEREWRIAAILERVAQHGAAPALRPEIDEDGIVRFDGRWAPTSPVEATLMRALIERFAVVASRDFLASRAWPQGPPTRNALDVHMLRLRRRIGPLGLEVRTVRSRGYLLHADVASAAG